MRVLILGGTQFVGRHMVETLLAAGHLVSILNRGKSPDDLPAHVERLRGDRDDGAPGLQALAGRSWDVCVDVSGYTPRQVRPSAERLRANVNRYVFVSAVSVYGDPDAGPVNAVWVAAEILKAAGLTFLELPLFRPERGARSGLMDVSTERARMAGLTLTDPEVTVKDMRAWMLGRELIPALSPKREAELIRIARQKAA